MKRTTFIIFVLVLWLATCKAPEPNMPKPSELPTQTSIAATAVLPTPTEAAEPAAPTDAAVPAAPTESAAPVGKLPAPPFPAKLYVSRSGGFALDYPDTWTVSETVVGDRGTQIQFLSSPDLAEAATIPEGGTRVTAVLYQWDPKNDLAAYVQQRRTAWEASGFTILDEQQRTLELGLQAVQLTVQTPDAPVVYLIAALSDQYLVISGEGDLELARQIMERVRPISQ